MYIICSFFRPNKYLITSETSFWIFIVFLLLFTIVFIAIFLTRGKLFEYLFFQMSEQIKILLGSIHLIGSLVTALILPNNYLNKIDYFNSLYNENELWIFASMIIIFFSFVLTIGLLFTLTVHYIGLRKE